MSTIVLSAGGTGGHLFPAQALAAELLRRGRKIVVMTDARGRSYEAAFPGVKIETVPSASPANTNVAGQVLAPIEIFRGVFVAFTKLLRLKPAAVALSLVQGWEAIPIHDVLAQVAESAGLKPNDVFMPIRLAVTGKRISPPIGDTLALLPKEVAMARITRAME